ncbi:hypothetical protein [Rhodanobacter sp. MP1X3]|uniref:hypothetical protein n=1 Tax=Rhodanobacter sp. MP1X3 TaxID=2723086 RepID=UPI0016081A8B|nr:hypothetical protein [Rhodanobacter sp. MP1X3]MBB6243734.1 hypothetical protein [Rhodanobacter sp. MP1X3]
MSNITIKNSTSIPGLVIMSRAGTLTGRLPIDGNGLVSVPTSNSYSVIARVTMEDGNTYVSGPASFSSNSQDVTAEVLQENGTFAFRLQTDPGTNPGGITLHNHTKYPVSFETSMDGNPLRSVTVIDDYNRDFVSTREIYTFKSIIDGVTSSSITTSNTNVTVQIYADDELVSDFVGYSVKFVS